MTTPRLVHRSVAVVASAGATAALALLPAGGAHAAVHGMYAAIGNSNVQYTGTGVGGGCTLSSGAASSQSKIFKPTHGTRRASVNLNATYTSNLVPTDVVRVKGHIDSRLILR